MDDPRVLAYVNGFRAARGLEPLDELPANEPAEGDALRSRTCPIAKATSTVVWGEAIGGLEDAVILPVYMREVIQDFDDEADEMADDG